MKNAVLTFFAVISCLSLVAQNGYYFPTGSTFDTSVPEPKEILNYEIGEFHTRYDLLVTYMNKLSESSEKVHIQTIGYTNEMRPQVVITITAPENYSRLEEIRKEHLKFTDPNIQDPAVEDQPAIILLGYNVHGNEPSSSEAAMLTAYYLTASTSAETESFLKNAVIMIDPAYNPDGRDRHTTWVNTYKGVPPVADPVDKEHNEDWPRGRTNHYWFDLNRDWLPLAQVESRNRMDFYHQWLPHMVTDFHEMGSNSSYFFEPTEPFGSENPLVPRENYDRLNTLMADYIEKSLNEMKSLYFTKEQYDNSYPGYGSTYPDIHGGLGLVFEQASSRGHVQNTDAGQITFPFSIRNHTRSSIASVRATVENKNEFIRFQSKFFKEALNEGSKSAVKGYVFGDPEDRGLTNKFAELLLRHKIEVRKVKGSITASGKTFKEGTAYMVPTGQKQYKMVLTMFKPVKDFYDSIFYDASAWTMALGYGIPYGEITGKTVNWGEKIEREDLSYKVPPIERAGYSYLMKWDDYFAPKALYQLQEADLVVRGAFKPFQAKLSSGVESFGSGSLMINLGDQHKSEEEVYALVKQIAEQTGVAAYSTVTGRNISGPDMGSRSNPVIKKPKAAMIVGGNSSSYEAGEVWHLLDERVGMPITKIEYSQFGRLTLSDYNLLILVSGNYSGLGQNQVDQIKQWVNNGGTVVAIRSAVSWLINAKLINETLKRREEEDNPRREYGDMGEYRGTRSIGGSIYMTDVDITHPIGFGLSGRNLPVYRNHTIFLNPSASPYHTVAKYTANPHLDGYIHRDNLEALKETASVVSHPSGRGRYILFVDNPNFRGYWYGTNKMFLNSLFLRDMVR